MVLRCAACDNALIRVVRQGDGHKRYWLDSRGVEYLQIEGATEHFQTRETPNLIVSTVRSMITRREPSRDPNG
jgi:hypothetical protein